MENTCVCFLFPHTQASHPYTSDLHLADSVLFLLQTSNLPFSINSIAYIEFKTEAEAEKMLEEAQGADVQGRSIIIDYVGEKSQKGAKVAGKLLRHLKLHRY